jgi:O-methyltransferase involved in polyketide biosynthesis
MEKTLFKMEDNVSETLIIPLYFRAKESLRPDALLVDDAAVELVNRIDFDFSRIHMGAHDQVLIIMRVREFDRMVRKFLLEHPGAAVVHIGCGLDTRHQRMKDIQSEWYDLDLPEVITLRRQLGLAEQGHYHTIGVSVFDFSWMDQINILPSNPLLLIAEGVFMYFEEAQIRSLLSNLREKFQNVDLICDVMTPQLIKMDNLHLVLSKMKARLKWGLDHAVDLESWAKGIRLLDEFYYFDKHEARLGIMNLFKYLPLFEKSAGIFHYKLIEA